MAGYKQNPTDLEPPEPSPARVNKETGPLPSPLGFPGTRGPCVRLEERERAVNDLILELPTCVTRTPAAAGRRRPR